MKTYNSTIPELTLKKNKTEFKKTKIQNSTNAFECISKFYQDDIGIYESMFILILDRANNTIGFAKISQGGTAGTTVDVKIIAKYAVDSLASGIILAHNHPSGNVTPSQNDIKMTKKVISGLELLDVKVLDHIILADDKKFYSFADEGLL